MIIRKTHLVVAALVGCFSAVTSLGLAELDESDFDLLQESLQPDSSEAWRQIPWRISLLDGQRAAVEEEKPIFIWAMDGHPLGCT